MNNTEKTKHVVLAVTGSRPSKLKGGYNNYSRDNRRLIVYFKSAIEKALTKFDTVHCISGGALGADTLWALAVLEVRAIYPKRVTLEMAIPFKNQACKWFDESIEIYNNLLAEADVVTNVSGEDDYQIEFMQRRNRYMVDQCDYLFAIYNGTTGGTHNCVEYAKEVGKSVTVARSFHK